jgi:hypothetical protein
MNRYFAKIEDNITGQKQFYWLQYKSQFCINLSLNTKKYNRSDFIVIWGRCNLKRSRRTVIFLPVYKISSLKITPTKTPNSGQFWHMLPNIVSFLFEKNNEIWTVTDNQRIKEEERNYNIYSKKIWINISYNFLKRKLPSCYKTKCVYRLW